MFKKTRFNYRFEAGFIVKIFVALAAVLFAFQRMADWPTQASMNPNALANMGIAANKLNFAQASQPSGIVLSSTGTSTISWVFDTSGWYQTTGSTLHTGDDDYAQDWSRGVGQTAGHTVYAAISGVVARSYFSTTSYGNTIVIYDSQSGFAVRYAHLQDRFVAEGQQVVAGTTPIGTVGNSGSTQVEPFNPHLHIVLYRNVTGVPGRPVSSVSLASSPPSPYRAPFVFTNGRVQACGNGTSEAFRNPATSGAPVHPNGTLIKAANDGAVYLIQNGQRRWVSSPEVLRALYQNGGFDFKDVITVATDELSSYPIGANITGTLSGNGRSQPEGRLIRQQGQAEVSIVTNNGMRRVFPNSSIFLNLGYLFCNVVEVSDYTSYPAGTAVDGSSQGNGGGGSTYPESPHPYPNFYDQTWTFTQPGNPASINVSFDAQTVVEQGYDVIYVTDGNGNNIPGSPFTGLSLAGQTKNVPGATVRVRLTSDGSVVYWGFRIANVTSGGSVSTPAAPSNLQAVAVSSSQVNLTWVDNSNNETGFKVQRKTGVSGTWAEIATIGQNVTSYQNTGLSPNTTYYYSTTSYSSAGQSAYSNEVGVTTSGGLAAYPESPHPYSNFYDQTWTFTQPGNPASINVSFDAQTVVEQGYDLIYVTDGNGNNIPGSPFTGLSLAGQTKNVPGATVRVRLTSDGSIVYWGFRITNVASGGGGAGGCTLNSTSIGTTISGNLAESDCDAPHRSGKKADLYTFNGSAGQRVTISMSSSSFDTYLFLTRTGGEVLAQDDDGAGGTNSRISNFTLPETGSYTIEATAYNSGDRGSYILSSTQNLFDTKADLTDEVVSVSAASFVEGELAEESIASIFGTKLAGEQETASSLPLPVSLAGATVKVTDSLGTERLAPLFFVSPTQINYQIPHGTTSGVATVSVTNVDGIVATGAAQIAKVAPGLFSANSSGQGVAAAVLLRIKADGSQSYEPVARFDPAQSQFIASPIDFGVSDDQVFLIFYGTGWRGRSSLSVVTANIGGINSEVLYAGPQEDFIGLDQLNLRVPNSLIGRGEIKLVLTVDGRTANPVVLNFR